MLIEILSTFHGFLCLSLIAIIYFSKPDTSGLSSLAQSFNSNATRKTVRFRPVTKLIFGMVVLFFINSIVLNKLISAKQNHSSITTVIDRMDEKKGEEKK